MTQKSHSSYEVEVEVAVNLIVKQTKLKNMQQD
jgi:hypothetical protein